MIAEKERYEDGIYLCVVATYYDNSIGWTILECSDGEFLYVRGEDNDFLYGNVVYAKKLRDANEWDEPGFAPFDDVNIDLSNIENLWTDLSLYEEN